MSCRGGGLLLYLVLSARQEERVAAGCLMRALVLWSSGAGVKIREGRRGCGRRARASQPLVLILGLWLWNASKFARWPGRVGQRARCSTFILQ